MIGLIALMGPSGCGKTTLANQLIDQYQFNRKPFAGPLKRMLAQFLATQEPDHTKIQRMLYGDLKEQPTEYFCGRSPRYAMQTLGTEWRDLIDTNLWVNAWERDIINLWKSYRCKIVVDDMRFIHEAERVRSLGGKIIRIFRPGYNITYTHISEAEFVKIEPDFVIHNNGSVESMFSKVIAWIENESEKA